MFDWNIFQNILAEYKKDFAGQWWEDEKYKWEMVRWFQDHWNIEAEDFPAMLSEAMKKTDNLLAAQHYYPLRALQTLSQADPEKVRLLFRSLYDESTDFVVRVSHFKEETETMFQTYAAQNQWSKDSYSYQSEGAISVYLWLRYPDTYYIYKYGICRTISSILKSTCVIKKGAYKENLRQWMALYKELNEALIQDEEVRQMLQSRLTDNCWQDAALHTLTIDFGYYLKEKYGETEKEMTEEPLEPADLSSEPTAVEEEAVPYAETDTETVPAYMRDDFLSEVYMDGAAFDRLAALVRRKKNVILEGAPGVGKTFAARRLAWALMGARDDSRIEMVQFHQSYSYEDFILGYKPDGEGFHLKEGVFYRFCEKAAERPGEDFFFLIDEINRGNLSKIFGELLMAIEKEYRGQAVRLPEGDRTFSVPENVYLIGMMNTADRSLALIDYALRRRFGFFEMEPGFSSEGFRAYQVRLGNPQFDALVRTVEALNRDIAQDPSLGKGFCIGHSYFCGAETGTEAWMESVVEYDLLPTLREYWYDEEETYRRWEARLREAVHGEE